MEDLQEEALRLVQKALFAVFVVVLVALASTARIEPAPFWLTMLLGATLALSYLSFRVGRGFAALVLVSGLCITLSAALYYYPSAHPASLFALVVVVAGVILDWRWGVFFAALNATALLAGQWLGVVSAELAGPSVLLAWAGAGLGWLLTRPSKTALVWAWHSYDQAQATMEELRDRQGELAQLSKSLAETCAKLEETNRELERARRAAERARQTKSEFAAAISHELRTPLNMIVGFSEMMALAPRTYGADSLPPAYRADVEVIYRNARHLSDLIDDVLDLAQIEAHRMALEKEVVSLPEVVEEAVSAVRSLFEESGLDLSVSLPADLPPLRIDRTRIRQVLINLLGNAARFTVRGGATISADFDDHEVVVAVADTGVGIPAEDLPFVFQEFRQLGASGQWRRHNGLGLAVCKRFVELHGGSIWVESRQGEGTTFRFGLPLCRNVAAAPIREDWQTWARTTADGEGLPTLLVVEPNAAQARACQRYLDGCRVLVAPPAEAGALAAAASADALLLLRPEVAGDLHWLRDGNGRLSDLPVITCDVHGQVDFGAELKVRAHLTKPITQAGLRAALQGLLEPPRQALVVDDDPEMARLLAQMVRSIAADCEARAVEGGAEALEEMRLAPPDLLLLDLLMPGVDGYAVLKAMQADPALRVIPVVVVSARGNDETPLVSRSITISRPSGLSVAETMACVRGGLAALAGSAEPTMVEAAPQV